MMLFSARGAERRSKMLRHVLVYAGTLIGFFLIAMYVKGD
jgi:hypothetical protein